MPGTRPLPRFAPLPAVALRVAFAAMLATVVMSTGCQRDETPQLLQVLDVAPREAEVGERLEISGNGFPQGRTAHVTFRGALYRPGASKETGAEVATTGVVTSAQEIEVPFTEALQALFCGAGETKAHTTFEGEVEVAFEAAALGAPPVAGTLSKVLLDVRPPAARRGVEDARSAEGDHLLRFLGVAIGESAPASGGLLVATVEPASRAEEAGLVAGDLIVSLDHVRVHGREDLLVAPSTATAEIGVRRDGNAREEILRARVQGAMAFGAGELVGAAVILVIAAGFLVVLFAPPWPLATWIERRIAARLVRGNRVDAGGLRRLASVRGVLSTIAITTAFAAIPIAQRFAGSDLDVGIVFLLAVTALVTMGLFEESGDGVSGRGFVAGLRGAARVASYVVPGALAVAGVVVMTGSLRADEIVRAQGGFPWEWYAFRSPVSAVLCLLFLATALAPGDRAVPQPLARPRATPFPHAERVYTFVVGGVASALFLGGWELPFAPAGADSAHATLAFLGASLFVAKAWSVVVLLGGLRATLPRRRIDETAALALRYLVPTALVMLGLTVAWVAFVGWAPARGAQTMVSAAMFTLFCVALAHLGTRVRYHLRASSGGGSLNPFL